MRKMLFRIVLVVVIVLVIILGALVHAFLNPDPKSECIHKSSAKGVVVRGYNSPGWIENTNELSLRIKGVRVTRYSEITYFIKELQPGETKGMYMHDDLGFHIYTLNGVEIEWIRPNIVCN